MKTTYPMMSRTARHLSVREAGKSEIELPGLWLTLCSNHPFVTRGLFLTPVRYAKNKERSKRSVVGTHRWRNVRNLEASSSRVVSQTLPGAEKLAAARPSVRDPLRGCWGPWGWRLSRSATKSGDFARPLRPPPPHTTLRRYCSLLWPCTTQHRTFESSTS